jgi:hypothetical protein
LLDAWEPIQPSASFNARLQQRILEEPAAGISWWERVVLPFGTFSGWSPLTATAMLAVVLCAVFVAWYSPIAPETIALNNTVVSDGGADELALYQDLPVLENWEMLSNFEVLQELDTATQ